MLFLGILCTGKIKVNSGYRDDQEEETSTLVLLDFIYMAWRGFLRYPTKLPADKNPQVNNQGYLKKMMACPCAIGPFKSLARFYLFSGLAFCFLYNICFLFQQ